MALERAMKYSGAIAIVKERVKPERETNADAGFRRDWWLFGRPRVEMREALDSLGRFVAIGAHVKRYASCWAEPWTLASNAVMIAAADDDYSMGILLSRAHEAWAWARSSTLKGDLRYTPSTAFVTFPFPDPVSPDARAKVAAASSALYARRTALCAEHQIGLTKLYNLMDEGGFADLKRLHLALDRAVVAAYGWPESAAQDGAEVVRLLTERNQEIVEGRRPYAPF